jgi:hypothetical protein
MLTWRTGKLSDAISNFSFFDQISNTYCLKVICHGSRNLCLPDTFEFVTFQFKESYVSGLVFMITRHEDMIKQRWDYVIEIRPRLHILALSRTIKSYPQKSTLDIVLALIKQAQAVSKITPFLYESLVTDAFLTTPFNHLEISYADNDLLYLQALMQYGIRFCFEQTSTGEKLILVDTPYKFPAHSEPLSYHPDKKEDVYNDAPLIYRRVHINKLLTARGKAIFYDPQAVKSSLSKMLGDVITPNEGQCDKNSDPLLWLVPCYSPEPISARVDQAVEQLVHAEQNYQYLYSYYSKLRAGQKIIIEAQKNFIESVILTGQFAQEKWRFDCTIKTRKLSTDFWLGKFIPRLPLPATLTGAEIQAAQQVNDLGEFKVKFPQYLFTPKDHELCISARDAQLTSTKGGGTSHSMSGSAEVCIASINGATDPWLILGSLDNNDNPSNVTIDNYQESKINTQGGIDIHLQRSDAYYPYNELNLSVQDSKQQKSGIRLGTNIHAIQENPEDHGIKETSTGNAKRVIMGDWNETIGPTNAPIQKISITKNPNTKLISIKRTINLGNGHYKKNYFKNAF